MSKEDYLNKTKNLLKHRPDGKPEIDEKEKNKLWKDKKFEEDVTLDEHMLMSVKVNIDRYTVFPERLPTNNEMPHPPDEHKRIGIYETKKDLYLITAHAYNKVMKRIEVLEQRVTDLENQP